MAVYGEGAPCWADVMLPDLAAGRRFYGELFGWTFGGGRPDRHDYTLAYRDGGAVAGLMSKADGRMPTVWTVYFSSEDVSATVDRIGLAGGQVFSGPERVGAEGVMALAADPSGAVFGIWQGEGRQGFERAGIPGTFCWVELNTWNPEVADPFYRAVFGYRTEQIGAVGTDFDYEVWMLRNAGNAGRPAASADPSSAAARPGEGAAEAGPPGAGRASGAGPAGGEPAGTGSPGAGPAAGPAAAGSAGWGPAGAGAGEAGAGAGGRAAGVRYAGGRLRMGPAFPVEMPAHFGVLLAVADCDEAAFAVRGLGGRVIDDPQDSPYGRLAGVADDQGARFTVIDPSRALGGP